MKAQDLKNAILQMAMQGKLVPQDLVDEPASALLDRIRVKRSELVKQKAVKMPKGGGSVVYRDGDSWFERHGKSEPVCIDGEIPFEIPVSWEWARLDAVANLYTGNSIPEKVKAAKYAGLTDGVEYIATKDLSFDGVFDYSNGIRIPYGENGFKTAKRDDILMCIEGGSAGRKIGILDRTVCFGNKLCSFSSYGLNQRFLYYFLQSPAFRVQFNGGISGIIGGVSIKNLSKLFVCVPPVAEQNRIVECIDKLMPLVDDYGELENAREALDTALPGRLRKSILEMAIEGMLFKRHCPESYMLLEDQTEIVPKDCIPSDWAVVELASLCSTKISYGIIKLGKEDPEHGVLTLRCSDVKPGYIDPTRIRTVERELSEQYSRTTLEPNDVVVNVRGTLGGVAVVPASMAGYNVAREVAVIRLKDKRYSRYVSYLLMSPYFDRFMLSSLRGIAYKGLNMGILSKLPVPLPPVDEANLIVDKLEVLLNACDAMQSK